jgi:hypothetical protein
LKNVRLFQFSTRNTVPLIDYHMVMPLTFLHLLTSRCLGVCRFDQTLSHWLMPLTTLTIIWVRL